MGDWTRGMALLVILVFIVGTGFGSLLPEFGNILARKFGFWAHYFNLYFLILGVLGIGVALYLGYRFYR